MVEDNFLIALLLRACKQLLAAELQSPECYYLQHSTKRWGFAGYFVLKGEKMRNKQENTGAATTSKRKYKSTTKMHKHEKSESW